MVSYPNERVCRLPFEGDLQECTNCNACGQICPRKCIKNKNGKIYLDEKRCISCNLCVNVCPILNRSLHRCCYPKEAYAAWSLDKEDRKTSTSGGAASVLYQHALKSGWYIVGAAYNEELQVELYVTNKKERIQDFKQSKYVLSQTNNCYKRIKELLNNDISVLFIGLPCQVAGLLSYLRKPYEGLVTIDIICHGTPSPQTLQDYIKSRDKHRKAVKLRFREDNEFCFKLMDNSGNTIYKKYGRTDEYLAAFLEGLNYQEQCYSCIYARPERISDLTIGDFWGLGEKEPFCHPYTGAISLILVNTDLGKSFLEQCKKNLFIEKRKVEEAICGNAQLQHPTPCHKKHVEFSKKMQEGIAFSKAVRDVLHEEMICEKEQLLRKRIRILGSKCKRIILRRAT